MVKSRYREERTLVRGFRRLPGESRATFKQKVVRLNRHFRQFNVDVSEICQWMMGLRPREEDHNLGAKDFWEFFLAPENFLNDCDESQLDRYRLYLFESASGLKTPAYLKDKQFPEPLIEAIESGIVQPRTPTAKRLFARLRNLSPPHRMILLKSAADWITARYVRGAENCRRQREEWIKEKAKWEMDNPTLAPAIRDRYNHIFQTIGVTDKSPRICTWERLSKLKDNCDYAGERIKCGSEWQSHSQLCRKYKDFFDKTLRVRQRKFFVENAYAYLQFRASRDRNHAQSLLLQKFRQAVWFPKAWTDYLNALGITEETILNEYHGSLPHCVDFSGNSDCVYNQHTEKCREYKRHLENESEQFRKLENLYREWRRLYLHEPRKPFFQYPSSRGLSVPKIFGKDYFKVDFDQSVLRLRLDDMSEGDFLCFGFKPWPVDYDIQPGGTEIPSVHIHFVGTRARVGFRFKIPHRKARLGISQDEIDELRSKVFPRQSQDQKFLDEVRKRILARCAGRQPDELKLLCVDLGETGGAGALFEGKQYRKAVALKIIKIDKLYDSRPAPAPGGTPKIPNGKGQPARKPGLNKDHIGRHLETWAESAGKISLARQLTEPMTLGTHDLRRLSQHISWMIRDWVRLNVSQIIRLAENEGVDIIVFESMRGFRVPGYDKLDAEKKRRLAFFAHGRVRSKTREKAVERGMRVVTVPYLYSSQFCGNCGRQQENKTKWDKNKRRKRFHCERNDCGYKANSDQNAARVLGNVFWGSITLPLNRVRKNP